VNSGTDDWHTRFFELESRLERLARRRFPADPVTADIAHSRVLDRLSDDNWAVLGRFDGRSAPATFLTSVYRNALEDVARAIRGRCRPPIHIQQLGELWIAAFELLCCQRRLEGELAGLLAAEYRPARLDEAAWDAEVRGIARRIRGRVPDCGIRYTTTSVESAEIEAAYEPDNDPKDRLESDETDLLTVVLRDLLTGNPTDARDTRLAGIRAALRALDLNPEAVLLARLVHLEGVHLSEAARMLGLNERTARRRQQDLFDQLREVLEPYV
jgi:RNA polymerase sigma factor (sigma-70 family)